MSLTSTQRSPWIISNLLQCNDFFLTRWKPIIEVLWYLQWIKQCVKQWIRHGLNDELNKELNDESNNQLTEESNDDSNDALNNDLNEKEVVPDDIGSNNSNENNVRIELPYKSRLRQNTRKPERYGYYIIIVINLQFVWTLSGKGRCYVLSLLWGMFLNFVSAFIGKLFRCLLLCILVPSLLC